MWNLIRLTLLLTLVVAFTGNTSFAIGTEFTVTGSDLVVDVNTKWIGGKDGGYYPVRVRVRNIGPARRITLAFRADPNYQPLPDVSRQVDIEQNQTLTTTLLIPLVDRGSSGTFSVQENSRNLKNMSRSINVADISYNNDHGPSMLVINDSIVDGQFYNHAISHLVNSGYGGHSGRHGSSSGEYMETVDPAQLPETWLAYTPVDLVAVSLPTFANKLSAESRQAILQWVQTGGKLIIFEVEDSPGESDLLNRTLDWNNRSFAGKEWSTTSTSQFSHLVIADPSDSSKIGPEDLSDGKVWAVSPETFSTRSLGLGTVAAFKGDPFPGTASHWTWLMNSLGKESLSWQERHGFSSRTGTPSFLKFLIPSVGRVPVVSFLLLITIFTVIIGPLNYGYFLRKKRLSMLLVTVPVLALGSSLLLIGYSTVAHGFSIKSRIRSVTMLDQKHGNSVSISRVAYYAGMAPSGGLKFEPSTAVYPIWASTGAFESGRLDWSDTQHFTSGWLKSRTRTQFLTVSNREQRGRIDFKPESSVSSEFSNGLEWGIGMILLRDSKGDVWFGENIQPGAVTKLQPINADNKGKIRALLEERGLGLPEGISERQAAQVVYSRSRYDYYNNENVDIYEKSQQEQLLSNFRIPDRFTRTLQPNSYFAILNDNPDLDLGMKNAKPQLTLHTLVGFF